MGRICLSIFVTVIVIQGCLQVDTLESECLSAKGNGKIVKLSLKSKKLESGEWADDLNVRVISSNSSDNVDVDVIHSAFECEGRRVIDAKSISNDNPKHVKSPPKDALYFHTRTGKNVAVINDGRSAQKINTNDPHNAVLYTRRALKDNEVFEIKLDKRISKTGHCLAIGIMTASPSDVSIVPEMHKTPHAWMYHHSNIYTNSAQLLANYGKNLDKFEKGDRVGVMRSEFGAIHFFVNGVDQGPAVSNIPSPVYGVVELWHDAVLVSIV